MTLRYTGVDIPGETTVEIDPGKKGLATFVINLDSLLNGDEISVDATDGGANEFGAKTEIRISNGVDEVIHTSCSTPFVKGAPAPLDDPKGDPSPTWFVVDFTDKP